MVFSFVKAVFFFIREPVPLERVVIGQNVIRKFVVGTLIGSVVFEKWTVAHNWEDETLMALEPYTYLIVKYYDLFMVCLQLGAESLGHFLHRVFLSVYSVSK